MATGYLFLQSTTLTAGTTFTSNSNTRLIRIRMVAGGGGGAGGYDNGSVAIYPGGGGGAGGYAEKTFAVAGGTAYTYAIGAGGAGGTGTNSPGYTGTPPGASGGNGGNTTFTVGGTTVTAYGGNGALLVGNGGAGTNELQPWPGGGPSSVSTNGDVNGAGAPGLSSTCIPSGIYFPGAGGSTIWGAGGQTYAQNGSVGNPYGTGQAGQGYGSGGGGSTGSNPAVSPGAANGGAGAPGCIVVDEYVAVISGNMLGVIF